MSVLSAVPDGKSARIPKVRYSSAYIPETSILFRATRLLHEDDCSTNGENPAARISFLQRNWQTARDKLLPYLEPEAEGEATF